MTTIAIALCLVVPAFAQAAVIYIGPSGPPPAPRAEVIHARPGHVWVGGHYGYHHNRYHWTRGHYVRERSGWVWRDGAWRPNAGRYEWHPGYWERR